MILEDRGVEVGTKNRSKIHQKWEPKMDCLLASIFGGFWCQLGSILAPKINQNSQKIRSQKAQKNWLIFESIFIDLGSILGPKLGPSWPLKSHRGHPNCVPRRTWEPESDQTPSRPRFWSILGGFLDDFWTIFDGFLDEFLCFFCILGLLVDQSFWLMFMLNSAFCCCYFLLKRGGGHAASLRFGKLI